MTYLLVAFLAVVLVPLFAASWRTSLLGLSLQGLLLAWIALRTSAELSASELLTLADLIALRGFLVPWMLHGVLSPERVLRRNDVIPYNLFSWMFVAAIVLASFHFANSVFKADGASSLELSTATVALLLGLFVLATQNSMFSQMLGLLRIENAIALYELMSPRHWGLPFQFGISMVFLLSIVVLGRFLRAELGGVTEPPPAEQRPSL